MTVPPTLLLVEDDPDLMEVLRLTFQKEGYQTLEAFDGVSALCLAKKHIPALAILDVMLPEKDGIEVCRDFRADADLSRVPVIMCTAKGEESDIVLGLGIGADDYIVKPFRPRELIARVKALLRRHSQNFAVMGSNGSGCTSCWPGAVAVHTHDIVSASARRKARRFVDKHLFRQGTGHVDVGGCGQPVGDLDATDNARTFADGCPRCNYTQTAVCHRCASAQKSCFLNAMRGRLH